MSSPAHSLIAQSHSATEARTATNGDGFGIAWYGERETPGLYRDVLPAWSDCNLKSLAQQIRSPLFLAHVRAATSGGTRRDNCHPFVHGRWSFMHNGQIENFERLRRPLETMLPDALYAARAGTTDSELIFLLALHFGLDTAPLMAVRQALSFIERLSIHYGLGADVRFTAAFSDGKRLYAIRYATNEVAPTLYASPMGASGYCLVSEPLDHDRSNWMGIPEQSAVVIGPDGLEVSVFETDSLQQMTPEQLADGYTAALQREASSSSLSATGKLVGDQRD